jgi:hypothetical protein
VVKITQTFYLEVTNLTKISKKKKKYTVRPDEAFRFAIGSFIENV